VTEQEWFECTDPFRKLCLFRGRLRTNGYNRTIRLFACACCRHVWEHLVDERSRHAVEVAERHADGEATDDELIEALTGAREAHQQVFGDSGPCMELAAVYVAADTPFYAARNVIEESAQPRWNERPIHPGRRWKGTTADAKVTRAQIMLLHDIFNNPFRPVIIDPSWLTPNVIRLAHAIYDDRDFDGLPILSDALEEAGCQDSDLLGHCRGPGPHVRGCWVIDLLLGKKRGDLVCANVIEVLGKAVLDFRDEKMSAHEIGQMENLSEAFELLKPVLGFQPRWTKKQHQQYQLYLSSYE
jgi:hypothetical protein